MSFPLAPLAVPNTDVTLPDIEHGMNLQVLAGAVAGAIGLDPTTGLAAPDYYSFTGKKGDDFTFETESQELPALANGGSVDTVISVYDSSWNLVPYYGGIAVNDDQFEGTDSLLDDVILPADGTYYVKVTSYAAQPGDPRFDPTNPLSPLYVGDTASILNPASPNYDPAARAAYIAEGNGTATGQYDLFIYKESQADPTTKNVNNVLVARGGGSTLASSGQGDTLVGGAGTDTYLVGSDTVTLSSSTSNPIVDLQAASLFTATIADSKGQASWPVTITYFNQDGSEFGTGSVTTATGGQALAIPNVLSALGHYSVTIDYTIGGNSFEMTVPVTMIAAQTPIATLAHLPSGTTGIGSPVTFSATLQNPYVGIPYTATWTFTNTTTSQQTVVTETVETSTATSSLPFTLTESFATAGTYSVQLVVLDTANNLSSAATLSGGPSTFTVIAQVATGVTVKLPTQPAVYTAHAYAPPLSSIVVADINGNVIANPSLTYTYYASGSMTPIADPTDVGTYQVVVTYAGDATHLGSQSQPATFTISPAPLTVTISDASKVYGVDDHASLSGSIAGLLGQDSFNATYSSAGSASSTDAGTYAITASLSAAGFDQGGRLRGDLHQPGPHPLQRDPHRRRRPDLDLGDLLGGLDHAELRDPDHLHRDRRQPRRVPDPPGQRRVLRRFG